MHCVNSSIFFPTFNAQSWLSTPSKVRLLQLKGYLDLTLYASRRCPAPLLSEINSYIPAKHGAEAQWEGIFARLFEFGDDGHAIKLGRAVANGENVSRGYEGEKWATVKGEMWNKIANMVADSVEDTGRTWVRSAGFEEAWEEFGERKPRAAVQG